MAKPDPKLAAALSTRPTPPPPANIQMGRPFSLSTDAQTPERENAQTPESGRADAPERPNAQAPTRPRAETPKREEAQTPRRQNAQTPEPVEGPARVSQGFRIRTDLLKRCRIIAAQQDRKMYELFEEALSQYLDRIDGNGDAQTRRRP